ncbi:unnamed protein product [Callosobruchus maculatus]|uniref:DUF4806 domain-containing protein n=1 Tax=Callosobruchus maculatus TaxID=64391 RepID=A0A653DSQ1_CALMS|nr:unnamed protein product [Callosobruchus maculatus]
MRPRKLVSSGDESESDDTINTSIVTSRPPPVQLPQIVREISSPNVNRVEVDTLNTPSTSRTYKCQLDAAISTEQASFLKIARLLSHIKEQNNQIIEQNKQLLSFFQNRPNTEIGLNEEDFPTPIPLKTGENLKVFEDFLNTITQLKGFVNYLSKLGGKDVPSRTNRIMKEVLNDALARDYNFYGKRNKKAFCQLNLKKAVIEAVKLGDPSSTEKDIEDAIKIWLKHAPERLQRNGKQQK